MVKGQRVTIVRVQPDHIPALRALFAIPEVGDAWPGDNFERLDDGLEEDDVVGMVVEHEGEVIGFIQYYEERDPNYRHAGIDIVLHPAWCNRGLGTDALRTLARHLFDDLGHHRITIDPRVTNRRAIASYRKVGVATSASCASPSWETTVSGTTASSWTSCGTSWRKGALRAPGSWGNIVSSALKEVPP